MELQILSDKARLFEFLKRDPGLHIYEIGDLDNFFWDKTTWFALLDSSGIQSLALLYAGTEVPTLILLHDGNSGFACQLLAKLRNVLPVLYYAHLSADLMDVIGKKNIKWHSGLHYKMILNKKVAGPSDNHIRKLTAGDLPAIKDFYSLAYPQNWFDSRMLATHKYYGYFVNSELVGISGVHVFSEEYKVAALGNIATHPDFRGQQIGYKITSALCHELQQCVDFIGLNVKSDNPHAIRCYQKIGFEMVGEYDECRVEMR